MMAAKFLDTVIVVGYAVAEVCGSEVSSHRNVESAPPAKLSNLHYSHAISSIRLIE